MLSPHTALAVLGALIAAAPTTPLAAQLPWRDPSPHHEIKVRVQPDVTLEVLDWGGAGAPLLLLGGLGNTAHIYDDFAPKLRDQFHVYALTRRGFGASSKPATGYDPATLARDVQAVLDTLGITRVNLVGESVAGEELTRFAIAYPERVAALVYLEAAYDRTANAARFGLPSPPPPAPPPEELLRMTAADSASPSAMLTFIARRAGVRGTEADMRAIAVFDSTGRLVRDEVTPPSVFQAITRGVERPDYGRIRAPTLAIFAVTDTTRPETVVPWYPLLDAAAREQTRQAIAGSARVARAQRDRFRKEMPNARVVEIFGARHRIVLSNEADVLRELRAFLGPR